MVRYICVSEYRTEMPSRVYAHGNTQYTCELLIATYNTAAIIQHCSVFNAVTTWVIFVLYIYTGEGRGEGGGRGEGRGHNLHLLGHTLNLSYSFLPLYFILKIPFH